ncbi:unnamed protein product [Effrenium voratum]|uniref:Uncharacterized protein n=2 Tax=Effrenium voratum TaxID=2562239 RepID=A0AA36IEG5_9DINO|nr:unnamed protein product [Effrenium voratum]
MVPMWRRIAICSQENPIGTLDGSVCKPSYLINGWNASSLANRTSISVAYDPAGEGDGEHVVGPVADRSNRRIYWITPGCASSSRRLAATVWKVKYLLDNQIVPDGTEANPLTCANESYVYAVNRYDADTEKFSLIYVADRANFPAPSKWTAYSWKIGFDSTRQRLYWWYYAGSCAVAGTCDAPLYYIDVGSLTDNGDMPSPTLATTVSDGYGHAYWDMTLDDDGNVYMVDWWKIRKYDPATASLSTLHTEDYLNTGWQFYGVAHWTGTTKLIVTKTNTVTSKLWLFDLSDSSWTEFYSAVHYEFKNLGQTMYNLAVDASHNVLYVATSGGNSAGRSIIELPLSISGQSMPYKACLQGSYSLHCPLHGIGERLVVGHKAAAFSVLNGKSGNFAAGSADRFPAWGTSQIAVLPATETYPARNPCFSKDGASIEKLSARLKATTRTLCGTTTPGFDTRHVLFTVDPGDKAPNYILRDFVSMQGLRTASDGSFGYSYVGQRRAYADFMDVATGGGNDGVLAGLKSEWAYGVAVKGPAVDFVHGFVYWISCERTVLPVICSEYALKRVPLSALEAAAKVPDPVDCSTTSCPHSGPTQVLDDRYAIIASATEVLYHQVNHLFPGADDTVPENMKLAIDQEAEIVYWLTPQPSTGYISLMYLDVRGWDSSQPPFEPCDVGEVAGHYANGDWASLVVACDGTLLSHEVDVLKSLDLSQDATVASCRSQAEAWSQLEAASRPGWKGCWTRYMEPGCGVSATGSCVLKAMTYDQKRDQVYYAFRSSTTKESISRFSRTAGSQGVGNDEVVYSGVFYEFPPRTDKGAAFISGLAVDTLNEFIYVANYYGNSAYQSLAMLPLPEHPQYPGSNQEVHKNYWPMGLVDETDAPIACLYGHESIPHSSGFDNRHCEYQGERLQWAFRATGFDVILPNPEGIKRYYVTDTSNSIAILPAKPGVYQRHVPFDWTQFFSMLPHASIGLSKTNGWKYLSVPVSASDLGRQPSFDFCAELCATFWRDGTQRCIGFDWRMSQHDCGFLQRDGLLPNKTSACGYSNSGLSCRFALVDVAAEESFTAWPNPCFTMPQADTDGNGWIIATSGYAPAGGWPSYVREGYSQDGARALLFLLKAEVLAETAQGQALRDSWRAQVPLAHWYGTTDITESGGPVKNGKAIFPGDTGYTIFKNSNTVDSSNPMRMPTTVGSCFSSDTLVVGTTTTADGGTSGGTTGGTGDSTTPNNGALDAAIGHSLSVGCALLLVLLLQG